MTLGVSWDPSAKTAVMLNLFQHLSSRKRLIVRSTRPIPKQPSVYLLASQRMDTIYIGVTADLIARLYQHRTGTGSAFTAKHQVDRLVRYEFFASMPEAIAREKQLKRWHRDWKINLIESENPDSVDLGVSLGLEPIADRPRRDGC